MSAPRFLNPHPEQRRAVAAAEALASNRHLQPGDAVDVAGHRFEIAMLSKTYPDGTRGGHPVMVKFRALVCDGESVLSLWKARVPGYREATPAQRSLLLENLDQVVEGMRAATVARRPHALTETRNVRRQISRALGD